MENRNLLSLKAEFFDTGDASLGLKIVMSYINANRPWELAHLLRYHTADYLVYEDELQKRLKIDTLCKYYNLLLIAVFAGYIPDAFDDETRKEIIKILDHPSVRLYYEKNYPDKIIGYTLQFAKEGRSYHQEDNAITVGIYNEFLALCRMLTKDDDLRCFQEMLDFVWFEEYSIKSVNNILSSYQKLNMAFTTEHKTPDIQATWGFIKYTAFLSQMRQLLDATQEYPLLQSSMWLYHGYYFERLNITMKSFFNEAFNNLEKALSDPNIFQEIIDELYGDDLPEDVDKEQLITLSASAIQQAREDVAYVLDNKWGNALKTYFAN